MSDAEGLQAYLDDLLRRQTEEFKKTVSAAQEQMANTMDEFKATVNKQLEAQRNPPPKYEAKIIDGGLWLNPGATEALVQVLDTLPSLLEEMNK